MTTLKKILIPVLFVAGFIVSVLFQRNTRPPENIPVVSAPDANEVQTTAAPVVPAQKSVEKIPSPTPVVSPPPTAPKGKYQDGTYMGDAVDAIYGIIQVKAVITNGVLSDVVFLSYPNDRENSIRISTMAMPILRQEAISVQGEKVNAVSGASYTSAAFKQSLGSALAQAK